MLITRKDLERILIVMDKFKLEEDWSGVTINYDRNPEDVCYKLSISFSAVINDVLCNLTIEIDKNTLDEEE